MTTSLTAGNMASAAKAAQRYIMIACSIFVVAGIGAGAFARYALEKDIYGLEEFVSIAAIWLYFVGAVYATHTRSHISAEIFSVYCRNAKVRLAIRILADVVTCALAVLYGYWGWEFFHWSITEGGKSNLWQIPLAVSHGAVFVGFVLMALYMLADLIGEIVELASRSMRLASQYPKGHPTTVALEAFAERIEEATNGRLRIEVHADNALGDYPKVYEQLSDGSISMGLITVPGGRSDEMEAMYAPYLATTYDDAKRIYGAGSDLFNTIARLHADNGVKFLGFNAEGFGGLGLTKTCENLLDPGAPKNIALRVPPIETFRIAAAEQGFQPVTVPFAELGTAMRTKSVDGWSGNTAVVAYHQYRDVLKCFVASHNFFEVTSFLMSEKAWNGLSAHDQELVQRAIAEISEASFELARNEAKCLDLLQRAGVEILTLTEEELALWADHARSTIWPKLACRSTDGHLGDAAAERCSGVKVAT